MTHSKDQIRRHNVSQREYFSQPDTKPRMTPARTPYVLRHLYEVLADLGLPPGSRLLDVGCGMGRFTRLLAEKGYRVTGVDLSPDLLAVAREELGRRGAAPGSIDYVCSDAARMDEVVEGPFDGAVGFFFLHHLPQLTPTLTAVRKLLRPGGRATFVEPNAFNPLFYLQILFTPGMSFEGDGGVARMRPKLLREAYAAAGLEDFSLRRYGFFPPAVSNRPAGAKLEEKLEALSPLRPILPFQVFSGDLAAAASGAAVG